MTRQLFKVRGYSDNLTDAVIDFEPVSNARRVTRAFTGFLAWLLGAAVSVLVPVGHFLLVPICLIAAFVTLATRLSRRVRIVSALGTCPGCGKEQQLDLPGSWKAPVDLACRECRRRLTLIAA